MKLHHGMQNRAGALNKFLHVLLECNSGPLVWHTDFNQWYQAPKGRHICHEHPHSIPKRDSIHSAGQMNPTSDIFIATKGRLISQKSGRIWKVNFASQLNQCSILQVSLLCALPPGTLNSFWRTMSGGKPGTRDWAFARDAKFHAKFHVRHEQISWYTRSASEILKWGHALYISPV